MGRENSVTAVVAIGIYLLFELQKLAGSLGVDVRTAVLGIMIGTITFGIIARWGIFFGLLATGVVSGDWVGGAVTGLAGVLTAVIFVRLWKFPDPRSVRRWLLLYLRTVPVVVVVYAVSVVTFGELSGILAFDIALVPLVSETLPLAILGLPVVYTTSRFTAGTDFLVVSEPMGQPRRPIAVAVIFLWAIGGYVGSFLFRTVSVVPAERIGEQVHPVAETVLVLSGYQGVRVVLLFNLLAVAVVLSLLYRGRVQRLQQGWSDRWS